MAFATNGDTQVYFEVHGQGPSVVLVHGVGGNHASWYNQVADLAARFQVVTIDARGFGNTIDREGLGRAAFVADLEAVLDAASIPQAILVGQSMGGGTCLAFTVRHPDRVRALVLADTLVGFELPEDLREPMAALARQTQDLSQAERVLGVTTRVRAPSLALLYTQIASFNRVSLKTLTGTLPPTSPQALAATGVPVHFIVGEEDVLFPPAMVAAVQAHVPGAALTVIRGAGHSAYFETPGVFNHVLESWLNRQGIGTPAGHDTAQGGAS